MKHAADTQTNKRHGHDRRGCHVLRQAYGHPQFHPVFLGAGGPGSKDRPALPNQNPNSVRRGCLLKGHDLNGVLQCCVDPLHTGRGTPRARPCTQRRIAPGRGKPRARPWALLSTQHGPQEGTLSSSLRQLNLCSWGIRMPSS